MTDKEINKQITRYLNGELSDEEENLLWIEFLKDKKRFRQFEIELNLQDLFQNKNFILDVTDQKVEEPIIQYGRWYAAAAALVLLISSFYLFFNGSQEADTLAIVQIELTEMIGSDIYRDQDFSASEVDYEINRAVALALGNEPESAMDILVELEPDILTDQQLNKVRYNKGILAYNTESYSESAEHFSYLISSASTHDYMLHSSLWYLANSQLKLKQYDEAVSILEKILAHDSAYQEQAEDLLDRLQKYR